MSIEDWQNIAPDVKFDFAKDNYFTELKNAEMIQNRAQIMMTMDQGGLLGKYYSQEWARKNILQQSDDDIEKQDKEIEEEQDDPRWNPPSPMDETGNQLPTDGEQPPVDGEDSGAPEDNAQAKKIREAEATVNLLSKKDKRSIQDESKYRSAVQTLARNK
jgi:hypothetical protein